MNSDATRGLALGVLIGAAIGLAAGILYAPQKGSETREMLRERAGDIRDKVGSAASRVKDRICAEEPAEVGR